MSLSKQLKILISLLFVMIFYINLMTGVNNIKDYLEIESQIHAQDTATSLGLSLSPHIANETDPILETMINAIFDRGYYREIKLVNAARKPLVTVTNDKIFSEVPQWFIDYLPMKTATAQSEIASGWNIGGTVYVTINPGYGYLKLYHLAKSAFYYSLATFVAAMALLILVLRFLLLPLESINRLALAIADGRFEVIEKLPWTTEVRNIAISMNLMSKKIEGVISNLNAKLESIGKALLRDDLTGLYKKSSFETDMKHLFMAEAEASIFIIKLDALVHMAKEQGHETVDAFLKKFAGKLMQVAEHYSPGVITSYRFFGSEFALLARSISRDQAEELAKSLKSVLEELATEYQRNDIAHIGVAPFNPLGTTASNLAAAHEAYEQAQMIGANSYYLRSGENHAKDMEEWKSQIFRIIDREEYDVSFVGRVNSFETGVPLMEDAFMQAHDQHGAPIPIGTFISIAERLAKIAELDRGITQKVMAYIEGRQLEHAVAVSLSTWTVRNTDFRLWLDETIRNQPIAAKLVFSLSAYAASKEMELCKEFIGFVHEAGAKFMIKRFDTQSMSLETLKYLKPDYIRLSRDLSNGLSRDEGKRNFVATLQEVAELLDIAILAEGVRLDEDYAIVQSIGLTGASR